MTKVSGKVAVYDESAKLALSRRLRSGRDLNIFDQTTNGPGEVAIYTLSDPRDVREVRYVGQTRNPGSRYSQHINAARLWVPDEVPWWIRQEKHRPLYEWIRALYADDGRLPIMYVVGWTSRELAGSDERRFVRAFVSQRLTLLNCEAGRFLARIARK